jgi:S1-C subfamily serine protease
LLLTVAILLVAAMFWMRANPTGPPNPLQEAADGLYQQFGFEVALTPGEEGGLAVKAIRPESPASQLGIQVGERIVAVGDRSVWHAIQLQQLIDKTAERGGPFSLMLAKDGVYRTVYVGMQQAPASPHPAPATGE